MTKKDTKKASPKKFFLSQDARPSKILGQNFLRDANVLESIGEIADLSKSDEVLEIGAGLGALTGFLAEKAGRVIAIEKDYRLLEKLRESLSHHSNVEIVPGDALKVNFKEFYRGNKLKVVSNLPYSVSSPILTRLLEEREIFSVFVLMVQREVGERISAPPGGRDYGSLSVLIQAYMDTSVELHVPPDAFWPQPKVHSVVLKLVPQEKPKIQISDEKLFRKIIRGAFSSRRKILANSLSSLLPKEEAERILQSSGIDGKRRAETLSIVEFGRLSEEFFRHGMS